MMLTTAASLAAVLAAAAAPAPAIAPAEALPIATAVMVVNVMAASDIPRALVTETLHEADAVWRTAGFKFIWERGSNLTTASLRVVIGGGVSPSDRNMPLAWIGFHDDGTPNSLIYVSPRNARTFMANSRETVGLIDQMTVMQRDTYLARAMGRALAHEIGHYLLASPVHSERGLMRAIHTAPEFFGIERKPFAIAPAERRQMATRFTSIYMASRG